MTRGERIVELRERRGLGQTDLAIAVGISKQTLYKYENDIVTNIPSDKVEKIAEVLNTTPAYIMGWDESERENMISEIHELFGKLTDDQKAAALNFLRSMTSNRE